MHDPAPLHLIHKQNGNERCRSQRCSATRQCPFPGVRSLLTIGDPDVGGAWFLPVPLLKRCALVDVTAVIFMREKFNVWRGARERVKMRVSHAQCVFYLAGVLVGDYSYHYRGNTAPYDKKGARWKAVTDAVAMYIAKDMVPIHTVEKPGFIHLLKILDPRYVLPGRKHTEKLHFHSCFNTIYCRCLILFDADI